ncbi:dehydrogenase/reductase SDR family member 13-like [Amphiura filiformis]|uniref:dehydrogenase/reductase SDR family member 13-like n=1 Tax=Amphiura filiformis TaxID=82378 RepID=UPI003B20CAFA
MLEFIGATWSAVLSAILLLYALFWYIVHGSRRYVRSSLSLKGKTVVITGASNGIGKETAIDLAHRGALVILACRDLHKGEQVARGIRHDSGNHDVLCRHLDLSNLESVREFVRKFDDEKDRLDILINNAGIAVASHDGETTKEGFDIVFGVNHFGHFLLTNLLVNKLKECAPSRVITVSSREERRANSMNFTSTECEGMKYPGLKSYNLSKAANIMFARELSRRLEGTGVTSYSVEPGLAYTNIFASNIFGPIVEFLLRPLLWLVTTTAKTGAQTTIFCAVDESITSKSGRLFGNCQAVDIWSPLASSDKLDSKLWEVSCQAVGIDDTL